MGRRRSLIALLLAGAGALAILARARLEPVEVRGRSMMPALRPGDRLLAVRLRRPPRAGEVVLAADPREPRRELVKRVAAVDASGVTLRGDHPAFSTDARVFGAIPADRIGWRVVVRYWPLRRAGRIPPAEPFVVLDEGGEPACAFPSALVADAD